MPRLELTLEEYNSVMEARAFVDLNEFCNKVNYVVDTIYEDVMFTSLLEVEDDANKEEDGGTKSEFSGMNSGIKDDTKKDTATNNVENKAEQKTEENKEKDDKGFFEKLGEKIHKIIVAITKFVSRIIPTIISKIKSLFKDKKDKPAVQEVEIKYLSETAINEGINCMENTAKVVSGRNGADIKANGTLIAETKKKLDEIRAKIEAGDANYIVTKMIKKGRSLKTHKEDLINMIKESKRYATAIEIPLAKLKATKVEQLKESAKKAFTYVVSCYTGALFIAKEHIKLITNSIKNINIALNIKDEAIPDADNNANTATN
jgi:hypothetical protein